MKENEEVGRVIGWYGVIIGIGSIRIFLVDIDIIKVVLIVDVIYIVYKGSLESIIGYNGREVGGFSLIIDW